MSNLFLFDYQLVLLLILLAYNSYSAPINHEELDADIDGGFVGDGISAILKNAQRSKREDTSQVGHTPDKIAVDELKKLIDNRVDHCPNKEPIDVETFKKLFPRAFKPEIRPKLAKLMENVDTNHDGKIDKEEFKPFMHQVVEQIMDADKDGFITKTDAEAVANRETTILERSKRDVLLKENANCVTLDQFKKALNDDRQFETNLKPYFDQAGGKFLYAPSKNEFCGQEFGRIMEEADRNQDGQLDYDEFKQLIFEFFRQMIDSDGDGCLTEEELKKVGQKCPLLNSIKV